MPSLLILIRAWDLALSPQPCTWKVFARCQSDFQVKKKKIPQMLGRCYLLTYTSNILLNWGMPLTSGIWWLRQYCLLQNRQSCPSVSTDALHLTKLQTLSAFMTLLMSVSKSSSGAEAAAMSQAPALVRFLPGVEKRCRVKLLESWWVRKHL